MVMTTVDSALVQGGAIMPKATVDMVKVPVLRAFHLGGGKVAKVGDIVTVEGKLILDRDFGFGYKYDLIIEKASITR